jgi:hypothetical protein
MSTQPTKLEFADRLNRRLLAASQLQTQAAQSVALDASALARKEPSFNGALTLLVLAILTGLAGRL